MEIDQNGTAPHVWQGFGQHWWRGGNQIQQPLQTNGGKGRPYGQGQGEPQLPRLLGQGDATVHEVRRRFDLNLPEKCCIGCGSTFCDPW